MSHYLRILVIAIFTPILVDASVSLTPDWEKIAGKTLPDIGFWDANHQTVRLSDYRGKVLILHPMFSHCPSACSIVSAKIAQAYKGLPDSKKAKIRVLSFSFDPAETDQGLVHFQQMLHAENANWKIVRTTPDRIQQLLDALDFKTLQLAQSNYEHANLVFIVNGDRVLRDYLFGSDLTVGRLMQSIAIVEGNSKISKSNVLALAVIGLLLCTFVVVTLWIKNKSPNIE